MAIVVISGPSGVGKSLVVAEVLKAVPSLRLGSSLTTREHRPGDPPRRYQFVDRADFEAKVERGELLEWTEYSGNLYGTLKPLPGEDTLLEIEVHGAARVKQLFPQALLVFMVPPGDTEEAQLAVLQQRLEMRGTDAPPVMQRRLVRARTELLRGREQSDVIITNDTLPEAARETIAAIQHFIAQS